MRVMLTEPSPLGAGGSSSRTFVTTAQHICIPLQPGLSGSDMRDDPENQDVHASSATRTCGQGMALQAALGQQPGLQEIRTSQNTSLSLLDDSTTGEHAKHS